MRRRSLLLFLLTLFVLTAQSAIALPTDSPTVDSPLPAQPEEEPALKKPAQIFWHQAIDDTLPTTIQMDLTAVHADTPENATLAFLTASQATLGAAPDTVWQLKRQEIDQLGQTHFVYQQTSNGLPVLAGEIIVHLSAEKQITAVNGEFLTETAVAPQPTITPEEALAAFENDLQLKTEQATTALFLKESELVIYNPALLDIGANQNHLAYKLTVYDIASPHIWTVLVDAHSKQVLHSYDTLETVLQREIYDLGGSTSLPGTLCHGEGSPVGTPSSDCQDAYDFSGETYHYFLNEHGRNSYDNAGATLKASVDYSTTANAFWNGAQTAYGPGFATKDVVAHEWAHAVTQHTAGLIYSYQSGALNESMSDVFGAMVDDDDWIMGEDLPIGAIRSLADPTIHGHPGKVSDTQYHCAASDNGGVHINSGVPNHAAYLISEGGSYNGYTITGLGRPQMAEIFYRALTIYMTSGTNFPSGADALISAATDLHGAGSAAVTAVSDTVQAVEMYIPGCFVAPDAYEADNTFGQASTITVNGPVQSHNFHRQSYSWVGDNDWVKFTAVAGQTYDIQTQNLGSGTNTMIYVYDTDGQTLLALDANDVSTAGSRIVFQAPSSADYYIYIRELYGSGGKTLTYDLSVTTTTDTPTTSCGKGDAYEPDDTWGAATNVVVDDPAQSHNLFCVGDEDWYSFTAVAGQTYTIETTLFGASVIFLMDTDGETLIASDTALGPATHQVIWTAPANATYYVQVRHFWGYLGTFGTSTAYDFRITTGGSPLTTTCQAADSYEVDNTFAQATPIIVDGSSQTHNHFCAGDEDWVAFTAVSGQNYAIEGTVLGSGRLYIELYGPDGTTRLHVTHSSSAARLVYAITSSGTYYARLYNSSPGSNSDYTVAVKTTADTAPPPCSIYTTNDFENNNTAANANTIPTDGTYQRHYFDCPNDIDWVKFTATAGTPYLIATNNVNSYNLYLHFTLYNEAGTVAYFPFPTEGSGLSRFLTWTAPANGTYTIRFSNYALRYGSNAYYDVSVTEPCNNSDGYEDDNLSTNATALTTDGSTQTHNFDCQGDVDWFKFTATANKSYDMATSNLGASSDTSLYLYNPAVSEILYFDEDGGPTTGSSRMQWTAPSGGTYYVLAMNEHDTAGPATNYDMSICEIPSVVTGLSVDVSGNNLEIDWDDMGFSSYEVWSSSSSAYLTPGANCSSPGAGLSCTVVNTNSHTHLNVANDGNNYYYAILGVNSCATSSAGTAVHSGRFLFDIVPGS